MPRNFFSTLSLPGSRSSTVRRRSTSVWPTFEPCVRLPSLSALTGVLSSRFDVSAALRMSASPMDRTASAWAAKSGEPVWALVIACMKESTFWSSTGTWAASTCGAIFGAWVAVTEATAGGASSVSVAVGGFSGAEAAWPDSDMEHLSNGTHVRATGSGPMYRSGGALRMDHSVSTPRFRPVSYTHLRAHETRHDL